MENKNPQEKIKNILRSIDSIAEESKYLHSVAEKYREARDIYHKELKDKESTNKMQCLMDVLNFSIENGTLKEMMSGTTSDGKPWSYPNLSTFDERAFKVIKNELNKMKSNKLRARYADFLWLTKKDYQKAKIAVDSYLKLIGEYEKKDSKNLDQHFGLDVLESFKRAFQISKSINYKCDVARDELKRLSFGFNSFSGSKAKLTIDLVEIAIENRKDFKSKVFWKDLIKVCETQAERLANNQQWYFSREFFTNIKKIEELILRRKNKKWDILIAESYVHEADNHRSRKSFAELHFLVKAIEEYKKLKDYKKVEELKKRYVESSKNVEFGEISTTMDVSEIIANAKKRAEKVCKLKPEEIIGFLLASQNFFPKFDQMEKTVNDHSKKYISHLFGRTFYDQNMNQPRNYSSDEEKHLSLILEQYSIAMSIYKIEIEILMTRSISEKRIAWADISAFFKKCSWFGIFFEIKDKKGKVILKTRKIIDLIEPGIKLYLQAIRKSFKKQKIAYPEIMLTTDSLAVKIEGIIREFYRLLGKPTFITKKVKGGNAISYEKDLNDFLRDEISEELFGKDLVLAMRYLLTEPAGINLRNNIGHCLIQRENYSIMNLHLLFLIILRLSGYKIEYKQNK